MGRQIDNSLSTNCHLTIRGAGALTISNESVPAIYGRDIAIEGGHLDLSVGSADVPVIGTKAQYCSGITIAGGASVTAHGGCKAVGSASGSESDISIAEGTLTWIP